MKFLILCIVSAAYAARLDNTYLPPSSSRGAGGNGNFLSTPLSRPSNGVFPQNIPQVNTNNLPLGDVPQPQYGAPSPSLAQRQNSFPIQRPSSGPSRTYDNVAPVYGPPSSNGQYRNALNSANILRFNNENDGLGSYRFNFETENKISQQEAGELKNAAEGEAVAVQGSFSYEGTDGHVYTVNYVADENGFQPSGEHIHQAVQMAAADAARSAASSGSFSGYNGNAQAYQNGQSFPNVRYNGNGQLSNGQNGGYQY